MPTVDIQVKPEDMSFEKVREFYLLCRFVDVHRKRRNDDEIVAVWPAASFIFEKRYEKVREGIIVSLYNAWVLRYKPRKWYNIFKEKFPQYWDRLVELKDFHTLMQEKVLAAVADPRVADISKYMKMKEIDNHGILVMRINIGSNIKYLHGFSLEQYRDMTHDEIVEHLDEVRQDIYAFAGRHGVEL